LFLKIVVFLFIFSSVSYGSEFEKSEDNDLAHILATMEVLYQSDSLPKIQVIQSRETIGECSVSYKECPDAKLFIVINDTDLSDTPLLYTLPSAKGWRLVYVTESEDDLVLILRTTLERSDPDTGSPDIELEPIDIDPETGEKWQSEAYTLKYDRSSGKLTRSEN